ncbi:MAG: diguanylate cyclase [Rhodoferax sp.]|nr:diguanylate cyclase [Rhodoferax sp.]
MSETSRSPASDELVGDSLQGQLFRYARDLQELMDQQRQLQKNYQMVLKSMGRDVPENDLLSSTLMGASKIHLITDPAGRVLRHGPHSDAAMGRPGLTMLGGSIDRLLGSKSSDTVAGVLAKFAQSPALGGIEQRRLEIGDSGDGAGLCLFDLLAMQVVKDSDRREIVWLLQPAAQTNPIAIQSAFINASTADIGFFVTTPSGTIYSVNDVFTQLTGFHTVDVLGHNPRILGSGRHENSFFQDFFMTLLETGNWNGQILNRKKSGQIFLTWQSVKRVEDAHGNITSYISAVADLSITENHANLISPASYHDPVTGLANRRTLESHFDQALEQARVGGSTLRALFIHVEGLGQIAEELGYAVFDPARREVGLRLRSVETPHLHVFDVGGGNYAALLEGPLTDPEVIDIAASTTELLERPLRIGRHRPCIKAFIGCSSYPGDGVDMGTLLRHADTAMYGAKQFATPFCFYESIQALQPGAVHWSTGTLTHAPAP